MSESLAPNEQAALDAVAALPTHDLSASKANAILRRSRAALEFQRRYENRPLLGRLDFFYTRFVEPALVTGAAVSYIGWALAWVFGPH